MGTDLHYKPGSFYRICDRTGFATRAEHTRMEWNNLIVKDKVWEARHPQDFVKGISDNQTVPYPRPRQPNVFIGGATFAQFEVYTSGQKSFLVQGDKIQCYTRTAAINPADYPSGF